MATPYTHVKRKTFNNAARYVRMVDIYRSPISSEWLTERDQIHEENNHYLNQAIWETGFHEEAFKVLANGVANQVKVLAAPYLSNLFAIVAPGKVIHMDSDENVAVGAPPGAGSRVDLLYMDIYEQEVDMTGDADIEDPEYANLQTISKIQTVVEFKVAVGTTVLPALPVDDSTYADMSSTIYSGGTWSHTYLPLAYITRYAGVTNVTDSTITDVRPILMTVPHSDHMPAATRLQNDSFVGTPANVEEELDQIRTQIKTVMGVHSSSWLSAPVATIEELMAMIGAIPLDVSETRDSGTLPPLANMSKSFNVVSGSPFHLGLGPSTAVTVSADAIHDSILEGACDGSNAILVWGYDVGAGVLGLKASASIDGGVTWGAPFVVESTHVVDAASCIHRGMVAVSGDYACIAYYDTTDGRIKIQRYVFSTATLTLEFDAAPATAYKSGHGPWISIDGGNGVCVWAEKAGGAPSDLVVAHTYSIDSYDTWAAEVTLVTANSGASYIIPSCKVYGANALVAWSEDTTNQPASKYGAVNGGIAGGTSRNFVATLPQASYDAYSITLGGTTGICAQVYNAGATPWKGLHVSSKDGNNVWGAIESFTTDYFKYPEVCQDGNGNFMVGVAQHPMAASFNNVVVYGFVYGVWDGTFKTLYAAGGNVSRLRMSSGGDKKFLLAFHEDGGPTNNWAYAQPEQGVFVWSDLGTTSWSENGVLFVADFKNGGGLFAADGSVLASGLLASGAIAGYLSSSPYTADIAAPYDISRWDRLLFRGDDGTAGATPNTAGSPILVTIQDQAYANILPNLPLSVIAADPADSPSGFYHYTGKMFSSGNEKEYQFIMSSRKQTFAAAAGQTLFTITNGFTGTLGGVSGFCAVVKNGELLNEGEYAVILLAGTVTLSVAAALNDSVVVYYDLNITEYTLNLLWALTKGVAEEESPSIYDATFRYEV